MAFNTSHMPQMVELPQWGGRLWQPLVDSGKVGGLGYWVWVWVVGL